MFTASHNPAEYNGIKMCLAGARPVGQDTGLADIRSRAEQALDNGFDRAQATGGYEQRQMLDEYAEHVRSFIDPSTLGPLSVVADTANGMGGLVVPKVFEGLPVTLQVLFGELDGTFPNHPADPIQEENLRDLKAAIIASKADIGLAFDGDADRVFLVDELAEPVSGSLTTALVARAMLEKQPGSTVLYNLICSKVVPETIEAYGGKGVRTRVGHSFIKEVMAETGAIFGGEHSGHYYFRDNYRADSGVIAALLVLEEMSASGQTLSELLAPYRRYADSGEINTVVDDPGEAVDALADYFAARAPVSDRTDGLTVEFDDWWFNVRPSNTEPLLRLNVEADSDSECDRHTHELLDLVAKVAGGVPAGGA
jgi:phosphomannomutase